MSATIGTGLSRVISFSALALSSSGTETRTLPIDVVESLRKEMDGVYEELASSDPVFTKVMESYFDFKKTHDKWAALSEGVWHSQLRNA